MKSVLFLMVVSFVSSAFANEGVYSCTNGGGRSRFQYVVTVDDDPMIRTPEAFVLEKSYKVGDFRGWHSLGSAKIARPFDGGDAFTFVLGNKPAMVDWKKVPANECFFYWDEQTFVINGENSEILNQRASVRRPTLKCRDRRPMELQEGHSKLKCADAEIL